MRTRAALWLVCALGLALAGSAAAQEKTIKTAPSERLNLKRKPPPRPPSESASPAASFTLTTRVLPIYVLSLLNLDEGTTIDRARCASNQPHRKTQSILSLLVITI